MGVDFPLIGFTTLYLFAVWAIGRAFQTCKLPPILGHFLAGVLMGPGLLDIVPYASDGHCETLVMSDTNPDSSSSGARRLAGDITFVGVPETVWASLCSMVCTSRTSGASRAQSA